MTSPDDHFYGTAPLPPAPVENQPPKLLSRLREHLRTRHYSIRTEAAYVDWARRFILFHGKRHSQNMGAAAGFCIDPEPGQDGDFVFVQTGAGCGFALAGRCGAGEDAQSGYDIHTVQAHAWAMPT